MVGITIIYYISLIHTMLESTFCHIQGIGETKERALWKKGCRTWDDFIGNPDLMSRDSYKVAKATTLESKARLADSDHRYFRRNLPRGMEWRAYDKFRRTACFLDIETTGLSPEYDIVTTVCVHSDQGTKSYVMGDNLHELKGDLKSFRYLVTFNGARFDIPFLNRRHNILFPQIHLDLLYPLRALGYSGGLKAIEKRLGMDRGSEGVDGRAAVRLWKAWDTGRTVEVAGKRVSGKDALDMLIDYNRDDTVNLEALADFTYGEMVKASGLKG